MYERIFWDRDYLAFKQEESKKVLDNIHRSYNRSVNVNKLRVDKDLYRVEVVLPKEIIDIIERYFYEIYSYSSISNNPFVFYTYNYDGDILKTLGIEGSKKTGVSIDCKTMFTNIVMIELAGGNLARIVSLSQRINDEYNYYLIEILTLSTWDGNIIKRAQDNDSYWSLLKDMFNGIICQEDIYQLKQVDNSFFQDKSSDFFNQGNNLVTLKDFIRLSQTPSYPISFESLKKLKASYKTSLYSMVNVDVNSSYGNEQAIKKRLLSSLQRRYCIVDRPKSGLKNVVCDTFVPKWLASNHFSFEYISKTLVEQLPKTSVVISRNFSQALQIKAIPIEDMIKLVGFSPKDVKALFKRVKSKKLNICFVGYGGTGMNTIHWLTEMCEHFGITSLFNHVDVYENDNLEFHNLLRTPAPISQIGMKKKRETAIHDSKVYGSCWTEYNSTTKLFKTDPNILSTYTRGKYFFRNINRLSKKVLLLTTNNMQALANKFKIVSERLDRYDYPLHSNYIFYGAPDLETRNMLRDNKNTLITATHGDKECAIDINPKINDIAILTESYGLIELNTFFMNQFRMSIGFLEVLDTYSKEELDDMVNHNFFNFSYDQKTHSKDTSRTYNILSPDVSNIQTQGDMQNAW